jgi:hypothetical protein
MSYAPGSGECFRAAVAAAYQVPYDETPAVRGGVDTRRFHAAWLEWASERGLQWEVSYRLAPVHMEGWIACVDCNPLQRVEGEHHAVAMRRDELLLDPDGLRVSIAPPEIRAAMWFVPVGTTRMTGRCWALPSPELGRPDAPVCLVGLPGPTTPNHATRRAAAKRR